MTKKHDCIVSQTISDGLVFAETLHACCHCYFQVAFEDVIAEPAGVHSLDCIWKLSYMLFEGGKNCQYQLSTILCGPMMALDLGCQFGYMAYLHIWTLTPALRLISIECGLLQKIWSLFVNCCCGACAEMLGNTCGRLKTG